MIYGIDYETRTMGGLPMEPSQPEPLRCDSCGQPAESLTKCGWDTSLMVGACCELEDTGCTPDEITAIPRIDIKPLRFVETAQGELFDGEVA